MEYVQLSEKSPMVGAWVNLKVKTGDGRIHTVIGKLINVKGSKGWRIEDPFLKVLNLPANKSKNSFSLLGTCSVISWKSLSPIDEHTTEERI